MQQATIANAFSVDLEDWFQGLTSTNPLVEQWPNFESRVVYATERLLAILKEHQVCATFFVLGYVADHYPDLIRQVVEAGHEVGVHGYHHRFVYKLTPGEFEQEVARSMEAVERAAGVQPIGHRAPYFSVNAKTPWAFERLEALGLHYDSSVFPTRNMLYGFPGAPRFPYRLPGKKLIEMPASTVQVGKMILPVAGGFYMRSLPYALTRWAIAQLNRAGKPAILYTHPWELDLGQSYRRVTPRERVTHYFGRSSLEGKLHRLFSDFRFTTMREVLANWQATAPVTQPLRTETEQPEAQAAQC